MLSYLEKGCHILDRYKDVEALVAAIEGKVDSYDGLSAFNPIAQISRIAQVTEIVRTHKEPPHHQNDTTKQKDLVQFPWLLDNSDETSILCEHIRDSIEKGSYMMGKKMHIIEPRI